MSSATRTGGRTLVSKMVASPPSFLAGAAIGCSPRDAGRGATACRDGSPPAKSGSFAARPCRGRLQSGGQLYVRRLNDCHHPDRRAPDAAEQEHQQNQRGSDPQRTGSRRSTMITAILGRLVGRCLAGRWFDVSSRRAGLHCGIYLGAR
eukprot:341296-Prymnesium_polylepis.1